jgi:hypothetical protein
MASKEDLSGTEIDVRMDELDVRIDKLRTAYEQYFIGVMKQQPAQQHRDVVRLMHDLEHKTFIRKTAQKFRLGSLVQKFTSYNTYWNRILRQIEEGTYKRDLHKVERREQRRQAVEQQEQMEALELDLDMMGEGGLDDLQRELDQLDAAGRFDKPKQPVAPPAAVPAPQPAATSAEDIRAQKLRELQRKLGLPDDAAQQPAYAQPTPQQPAYGQQPAYAQQPAPAYAQQAQPAYAQQAPRPAAPVAQASDDSDRRNKLEEMKRRLEERSRRAHAIPSASELTGAAPPVAAAPAQDSADVQRMRKLREMKERMEQRGSGGDAGRAIERPSITRASPAAPRPSASGDNEDVMRVYKNLVEAKKRCNEPVQGLSYESVAHSMQEQRDRLRQSHGADDVDFKVVIKNGRAFLKPEPK